MNTGKNAFIPPIVTKMLDQYLKRRTSKTEPLGCMVKGFFAPKRQKFFEKIEIFLLLLAQVPVTSTKKSIQ